MRLVPAFRRLWRHIAFRRLFSIRLLGQAADGTLQVGMASYVLFSPQTQATAWAIAGVLAITLLPYTILGPFVSTLLDRWSRRNVALYSDISRATLSLLIAGLIFTGHTSNGWELVLFLSLLVAVSINRFMLAGLSAGLQHTVEPDEYVTASSIVPTVGPLGLVIGAVLGFVVRTSFGFLTANQADALVFAVAALLFLSSVLICLGFSPAALGPHTPAKLTSAMEVLHGIGGAFSHIRQRQPAALALTLLPVTRLLFGLLAVAMILAARNLFHPPDRTDLALADLTMWGILTGAGFVSAAAAVPVLVERFGLRRSVILLLSSAGIAQAILAFYPTKAVLFTASFLIGLVVQAFKICVDAIVQAHISDDYKGRVFTIYDAAFNTAFVLAGVVAAWILPPTGLSTVSMGAVAVGYLGAALFFAFRSRQIGSESFEVGSGDLVKD